MIKPHLPLEIANVLRVDNLKNLSLFNPADFPTYNYPPADTVNTIASSLVPSLSKRLYVDKSTADDAPTLPQTCSSDPCIVRILTPAPAFSEAAETDIRVAYSPIGYSNNSSILVGVKLPPDNSGIKRLRYKVGSSSPSSATDGNVMERTQQTIDNCAGVLTANGQTAGWVDFCFVATAVTGANIYVWLEDNAGNIGHPGGVASRKLFIDTQPPNTATNLATTLNPVLPAVASTTLTFTGSSDASNISHYKVCYWQELATFSYNDLLHPSFFHTRHMPYNGSSIGQCRFLHTKHNSCWCQRRPAKQFC